MIDCLWLNDAWFIYLWEPIRSEAFTQVTQVAYAGL